MTQILEINSSGREAGSVTRTLTRDLVAALQQQSPDATVTRRDLSGGIRFVDAAWIDANFTPSDDRSGAQRDALAESDALVAELVKADTLVLGSPIYNFGVPAALKAWIDQVARARVTFRYTDRGPVGLLTGKRAYVVVASGGVTPDSPVDFATPYLRHALQFLGITDIHVITAPQAGREQADVLDDARRQIADAVFTQPAPAAA